MSSVLPVLLLALAPPTFAASDGACDPGASPLVELHDAVAEAGVLAGAEPPRGGVLARLAPWEQQAILEGDLLYVPPSVQDGSNCMFHVLRMVTLQFRATGHDVDGLDVKAAMAWAKAQNLTKDGGLTIHGAKKVIDWAGYTSLAKSGASMKDVEDAVRSGTPVAVIFYVDPETGGPATTIHKDNRGNDIPAWHAAVVEGFYEDNAGRDYVIVKHGWRKEPYVYLRSEFEKSWALGGKEALFVHSPK